MSNRKGKRALYVVLIFALLLGIMAPAGIAAAAQTTLSDIAGSYAKKEIEWLIESGIVSGYEDGTFRPSQRMTRAELAKIITLALGLKENPAKAAVFADVAETSWYRGFVGALAESGIAQGTSANAFSPDAPVTREELVVFFVRAMGLEETAAKLKADAKLSDLHEVSDWAKPHVSLSFQVGFVNGIANADGTLRFAPKEHAERQALARLAYEFKSNKSAYAEKAAAIWKSASEDEVKSKPSEKPPASSGGTPIAVSPGSGGGSDSSAIATLNAGGTYNGNLTVSVGGTFGPSAGKTTINGTLTLNPGANGTVELRNVEANELVVLSGDDKSIKLMNAVIRQLRVNASNQTNPVRIQTLQGTAVTETTLNSGGILESTAGSIGNVTIGSGAANRSVELRGTFNGSVTVAAPGSTIVLAPATGGGPTTISSLNVSSNTTINASANATLQSITLGGNASVSLQGSGSVQNVTIPEGSGGTTLTVGSGTNLGRVIASSPFKLAGTVANLLIELTKPDIAIDTSGMDQQSKELLKTNAVAAAIAAIESLGTITLDKEASAQSARGKVYAAKALGAADSQISNMADLAAAEARIVELKADKAAAEADRDALAITFANGESAAGVIHSVTLPTAGANGSTITWSSDKSDVISAGGVVTRPTADTTVILTATVSKGGTQVTKSFTLVVKAAEGFVPAQIQSAIVNGNSIAITLNQTVTSATYSVTDATYGGAYTVTAATYTYNVAIWPSNWNPGDSSHNLKLTGIHGPGTSGKNVTVTFEPGAVGDYVAMLYMGQIGQPDFAVVSVSAPFAVGGSGGGEPKPFVLSSTAFENGQPIPNKYAKQPYGTNTSIPLAWSGVPEGTKSLALLMYDQMTGYNFVHWGVFNIAATASSISENATLTPAMPAGSIEILNDYGPGSVGYGGPQPPASMDPATGTHLYKFVLFALNTAAVNVAADKAYTYDEIIDLLNDKKLAQAELSATYFVQGAPSIEAKGYTVGPGTAPSSTKITYTPSAGNSLRIVVDIADNYIAPLGQEALQSSVAYTSGEDITDLLRPGRYIGLFEVNGAGQVVKYTAVPLTAESIRSNEKKVTLDYLGHSAFILSTEQRKVLIDPWTPNMFGLPNYSLSGADQINLVTVSHRHEDHNYVQAAPSVNESDILHGTTDQYPYAFQQIDTVKGDLKVQTANLPHFDLNQLYLRDQNPNAAFIFEAAGMRIVHFGDGMGPIIDGLTGAEIASLKTGGAAIDMLMLPIGDSQGGALNSDNVFAVIEALQPKIVVPIHPWNVKEQFLTAAAARGYSINNKGTSITIGATDIPTFHTKSVIWNMASSKDIPMTNNLSMTSSTTNTASFTFTLPAGATGVTLLQSADDGATWVKAATTQALSPASAGATAVGLAPGNLYKFRLEIRLGAYSGYSNAVIVTTTPSEGQTPSDAYILYNLLNKLGINSIEQNVKATADINVAAEMYHYNKLEVTVGWGSPSEWSTWHTSAALAGNIASGTPLIHNVNATSSSQVWYRLVDAMDNKSAARQDGIIPPTPINDDKMNAEFVVVGHEGIIRIINDNKYGPFNSVNGFLLYITKNDVPLAPIALMNNANTDITIPGGLNEGDRLKLSYLSPEGNSGGITEYVLPDMTPATITVSFGDGAQADTVQLTGLQPNTPFSIQWKTVSGTGPSADYASASGTTNSTGTFDEPLQFGGAVDGIAGATGIITIYYRTNPSATSSIITAQ